MEHIDQTSAYMANQSAFGNVRIWQYSPISGIGKLLVDAPNLITKQGAGVAARALSGLPNTAITHMYVEYNDTATVPAVTIGDTPASIGTHIRKALAFSPSFANESGYTVPNLAYFTTFITGSDIPDGSDIVSLGLISATNPNNSTGDLLFSRIAFNAVTYDAAYGLAITWGITFRAQ